MKSARVHLRQAAPAAFTLVEMVLATFIMAIILLGMHSAMLLASRANPDRNGRNSGSLQGGLALDQLSADLAVASAFSATTATSVTFTVPDRNGDGTAETIQYSWSGAANAPLLRSANGGTAVAVASNVNEFALVYDKRSKQRSTTYTNSGEVLLSSYDGIPFPNLGDFDIDYSSSIAQAFQPSLPAGAVSWGVTRAKIRLRSHGSASAGKARLQVRTISGVTPQLILGEASIFEWTLNNSYAWQEYTFTGVSGRPVNSWLCLAVQWVNDADACDVQYQAFGASASNMYMVRSFNGGSSWSFGSTQDMAYYVWGTYTTQDPVAYDYWLTGVRCTLRCGADSQARVRTTVRIINQPQVSGP